MTVQEFLNRSLPLNAPDERLGYPAGLVPIVVGATGHRDIPHEDVPRLKEQIIKELSTCARLYPNSPRLLLTGLADGADRVVAQCAIDQGWHVGAVLALPRLEFEQDFSDDSREEFRVLLAQCVWARSASAPGCRRPDCYSNVAVFIARYAQWLLALWDGQPVDKEGGTYDVVTGFLTGRSIRGYSIDGSEMQLRLPDTGPVIHVITRRVSNMTAVPATAVGQAKHKWPTPFRQEGDAGNTDKTDGRNNEEERWRDVLRLIDGFNRRARTLLDLVGWAPEHLVPPSGADERKPANELAERARALYSIADTLAVREKAARKRMFRIVFSAGLAGLVFEQFYSGPLSAAPVLLLLAVGCVLLAAAPALLRRRFERFDAEARFLDYRALAEACRVQYFWKLGGIAESAADYHLTDQRDSLEWIRQATRSTELGPLSEHLASTRDEMETIRQSWIEKQKDYFVGTDSQTGAERRTRQSAAAGERAGWRLLTLAATVAAAVGIVASLRYDLDLSWPKLAYGLLLTAAGAISVYQQTEGNAEKARNYRRLGLTMKVADDEMRRCLDRPRCEDCDPDGVRASQDVLKRLGRLALDENSDWLLLLRDRPIGPPVG